MYTATKEDEGRRVEGVIALMAGSQQSRFFHVYGSTAARGDH